MPYATASDVQAIYGKSLTTEETALVERRLAQVERKILRRIPDLADQIAAEEIDQADVVDIEAEAVLRVLLHGDGIVSENDGNYGFQKSYNTDGSLRITPDEWERLGIRVGKMFGIAPGIGGVAL